MRQAELHRQADGFGLSRLYLTGALRPETILRSAGETIHPDTFDSSGLAVPGRARNNLRMQLAATLIVVAIGGWICYCLLRPPAVFVIRLSRRGVRFRGSFPLGRRPEVEAFLTAEFAACGRLRISGVKSGRGGMRFLIQGPVSEGDRQRIRNFLQTIIR